jgi:hypothetical protein
MPTLVELLNCMVPGTAEVLKQELLIIDRAPLFPILFHNLGH